MQRRRGAGSQSEDADGAGMTMCGSARTHHRVHVDGTGPGVLHVGEDGGATAPSLLLPLVAACTAPGGSTVCDTSILHHAFCRIESMSRGGVIRLLDQIKLIIFPILVVGKF